MTFDELWPTLAIPGEFDAMDACDQARWRGVVKAAFEAEREARKSPVIGTFENVEDLIAALKS